MSGRKEILWKSSLASIVPHGMWVNHRRTSNPFSACHAPCPGPRLQVVRPATSCYSNRTRAELRIDHSLLRHFLVSIDFSLLSFPFLSFSPFFGLFPFSFPSWQIWDRRPVTSHVFCDSFQLGREVKNNRYAILLRFPLTPCYDVSVSV